MGESEKQKEAPPGGRVRRILVGRHPRRTGWRALGLAVFFFLCFRYALLLVWVDGVSMAPTVETRTLHLAWRLAYALREPRIGDIVVIELAGKDMMFLKRILAGPGSRVAFADGVLFVDGRPQPEPYVVHRGRWTTPEERLAPDEYFVAGDNRDMPWQSHTMGAVARRRIAGRLWL